MVFVALLRGINVGGNSKVEMAKLKELFESLGCRDASTYINSGNVVFQDKRPVEKLVPLIEEAIFKTFDLNIRIVLRNSENIRKLCKQIPDSWTNDKDQKTDVLFLWDEIDNNDILDRIVINPKIENVLYVNGALIWNIGRENVAKGAGVKLIKTNFYKHMTVRNINTVRKLHSLMSKYNDK